jgi:hypothetical protein
MKQKVLSDALITSAVNMQSLSTSLFIGAQKMISALDQTTTIQTIYKVSLSVCSN